MKKKATGRLRQAYHAIFVHHVVLPSIYFGLVQNRRGFRSWYPSSPIKCGGRNVIVNVNVNEFIQRIFYWHIQMRFTRKWSMGESRHQHIKAPLAAAISPLAISPNTSINEMRPDHNTLLFATSVWALLRLTGFCEQWRVVRRGYGSWSLSEKTW